MEEIANIIADDIVVHSSTNLTIPNVEERRASSTVHYVDVRGIRISIIDTNVQPMTPCTVVVQYYILMCRHV